MNIELWLNVKQIFGFTIIGSLSEQYIYDMPFPNEYLGFDEGDISGVDFNPYRGGWLMIIELKKTINGKKYTSYFLNDNEKKEFEKELAPFLTK